MRKDHNSKDRGSSFTQLYGKQQKSTERLETKLILEINVLLLFFIHSIGSGPNDANKFMSHLSCALILHETVKLVLFFCKAIKETEQLFHEND